MQKPFSHLSIQNIEQNSFLTRRHVSIIAIVALVAERTRVLASLRAHGVEVPETQANFYWLPLGERTALPALSERRRSPPAARRGRVRAAQRDRRAERQRARRPAPRCRHSPFLAVLAMCNS